ncbi:MAG: biopolymer transporter ExbB [Rhodobacteraceae bacterium]|nr:MAG: biopolymer transporter ExbB [Paracoccaceae bacterium]
MDTRNDPEFTQPVRQIVTMLLIMVLVGVIGYLLFPTVSPIFLVSPYLNGFILSVFVFGVFASFWQLRALFSAVGWIEGFAMDRPGHEFVKAPRLLASLAALLSDSRSRKSINSSSAASILDSVSTRLDEARDILRYIVNLLIFLGLLGTFYGLATTIPAVVDTIRTLAPTEGGSSIDSFDNLMTGLEEQLGGMGTAFASSLLGLAGSLIIGLLEIFAGHGQNRFYMELEEWLSSITKVGFGGDDAAGIDGSVISELMGQTTHQIESLKELVMRGEEQRMRTDGRLASLAEAISVLAKQISNQSRGGKGSSDPDVMERIAGGQDRIVEALGNMGEGMDAEARMRLRNIDVQLLRVLEEMSSGRQDSIAEIRQDFATLIYTLQQAINQDEA